MDSEKLRVAKAAVKIDKARDLLWEAAKLLEGVPKTDRVRGRYLRLIGPSGLHRDIAGLETVYDSYPPRTASGLLAGEHHKAIEELTA